MARAGQDTQSVRIASSGETRVARTAGTSVAAAAATELTTETTANVQDRSADSVDESTPTSITAIAISGTITDDHTTGHRRAITRDAIPWR